MTATINAYMCCEEPHRLSIAKTADAYDFDAQFSGGHINAKISIGLRPVIPAPGCSLAGLIQAKMAETGKECCYFGDGDLGWQRGYDADDEGNITAHNYVTVEADRPTSCAWTQISIWLEDPRNKLFGFAVAGVPASPVGESGQAVFNCGGTAIWLGLEDVAVPGDQVILYWHFKPSGICLTSAKYYSAPAVTGGPVTEVVGEYGDPEIKYNVDIEGEIVLCSPSDFAEYGVGDWVYVVKTGSEACTCDRCPGYGEIKGPSYMGNLDSNDLLTLVNSARTANGLSPLYYNADLNSAAIRHVRDMATNVFISHTGSDGSTPGSRIEDSGYAVGGMAWGAGENVAKGYNSIDTVFRGWMASTVHRANILHPDYKEMGMAAMDDVDDSIYWCQTFGYNAAHDPVAPSEPDYMIFSFIINSIGPVIA